MQIRIRNADVLRRHASKLATLVPHWTHTECLRALAAMLGQPSWEALLASASADAPAIVFDQDLPREELAERRAAMAQAFASHMGVYLHVAYDLVCAVHPLSDVGRDPCPIFINEPPYLRAQEADGDVWWISSSTHDHPLVPHGYLLCTAVSVADRARELLKHMHLFTPLSSKMLIVPEKWLSPLSFGVHVHRHYRGSIPVEVNPIPPEFALRAPSTSKRQTKEFFDQYYPTATPSQRNTLLKQWIDALSTVKEVAGLKPTSRRPFQATSQDRLARGLTWLWPLQPTDARWLSPDTVEVAEPDWFYDSRAKRQPAPHSERVAHVSLTDLEGDRCPDALRHYATVWIEFVVNGQPRKTTEHLNNADGRRSLSVDMEALLLEAMERQLDVRPTIRGRVLQPGPDSQSRAPKAKFGTPD